MTSKCAEVILHLSPSLTLLKFAFSNCFDVVVVVALCFHSTASSSLS
jgi:hypothetical protein